MLKCARHTSNYKRTSKADSRRFATSPLVPEVATTTEITAVAVEDTVDVAEVVVALEEEVVADGDDESTGLRKEKRRLCSKRGYSLVGLFLWRNTRMRHGSEALDRSFVFLHIPSAEEARILKAIASHETGSLMNVTSAVV